MEPIPPNDVTSPDTSAPTQLAKPPMLAWWGIFPVVAFVALESILAQYEPPKPFEGPGSTIGYVVGGTLFTVLLAGLVAWIVYRISGRGQLEATVTFTSVIALLCMVVVVDSKRSRSRVVPPAARASAPVVRDFPSAGISVDTPAGWRQVPAEKAGIVTQWVGPDSTPGDVRQMIIIQAGKGRGDTVATANALAAKWGGRVVNDHVNLDGETACLVQAQPTKPALQPVEGLVAIHAGNLYLMTGGVTPGHSCDAEFETIRQSWKWIPIGAPEKEGHKP